MDSVDTSGPSPPANPGFWLINTQRKARSCRAHQICSGAKDGPVAISQIACAVAEKLCTLISVGEPPTNCQICSEHLATFIASGGIKLTSTAPGQHLKAIVPESPETRTATQGTAAGSSLNSTIATSDEVADPPPIHAEQLKLAIEEIELGVVIDDSKVGDTNPLVEPKAPQARPKKLTKAGKAGAKRGDKPEPDSTANTVARKASKARDQVTEDATPPHTKDVIEDTKS